MDDFETFPGARERVTEDRVEAQEGCLPRREELLCEASVTGIADRS